MAADEVEDDNAVALSQGAVLSSEKAQYVLDELLGEGGFGAVWRVHLSTDSTRKFAMKIEKKVARRRHSKLKMEIAILKFVLKERKENRHFTPIVDRGKKANFFFLVMQLVGRSLEDLLDDVGVRYFSLGTALGIGIQSLEALEDLHKYGFIHRDVKPANYACGMGDKSHVIYLLDFGIARKYVDGDLSMKTPREQVTFKGTIRYASLACHRNKEMGPKDDAESWFYMISELMNPRGLPWRRLNDRSVVQRCKEESRANREYHLVPNYFCREELESLLKYIDGLSYTDRLDYNFFYAMLRLSAQIDGVNLNGPFEWEKTPTGGLPVLQQLKEVESSCRDAKSKLKQ